MKIGEVQGVEIYSEYGQLSDIWFVQEHVRYVFFEELVERYFEIANALIRSGYKIKNPKEFNLELKTLLLKAQEGK